MSKGMNIEVLAVSLLALAFVMILPSAQVLSAAEVRIESESIIRSFERDTTTDQDELVLPLYEYLGMEMTDISSSADLSIHAYGWGRIDIADSGFYDDNTEKDLLYGYLAYKNKAGTLNFKAGRQHIFAGISNESVDGILVQWDLPADFSVSAYGGLPVSVSSDNGSGGDSIAGGRVSHSLGTLYELGFSFKQVVNNSDDEERKVGLDFSLHFPKGVGTYGFVQYNLETDGFGEFSVQSRFSIGDFDFRPAFERYEYDDYLTNDAKRINLFNNLAAGDEVLTTVGGDIVWSPAEEIDLGCKIKHFDYDKRGNSSQLYSSLLHWRPDEHLLSGIEIGYMDGDVPENQYLFARLHAYRDTTFSKIKGFVSGDLMYVSYEEAIYGKDDSFFVSLGGGGRFFEEALELKISGDYSIDPYNDNDLRSMLVVKYVWF